MPLDALTLYDSVWPNAQELEALVNTSFQPRHADMLYAHFAALKPQPCQVVLDVGCRDCKHAIILAQRFGCRVIGVDPVPHHRVLAEAAIAAAGMQDLVSFRLAGIESLPMDSGTIDLIWCRDMLNHVALRPGLAECARVLRPGGTMLVYQTFATELLEPREAERLYRSMAIIPANMVETFFQTSAEAAGLLVELRDVIGSEWRERWAEDGSHVLLDDLLAIARLHRQEQQLRTRYGDTLYEASLGGFQWGIYQMLGKLLPVVYVLRLTD